MHSINQSPSDYGLCAACAHVRAAAASHPRHWLLDAAYGRELLKLKLRQLRPDLNVPRLSDPPEQEPLLEQMVDEMGLRGWPRPVGIKSRLRYLKTVILLSARFPGDKSPATIES